MMFVTARNRPRSPDCRGEQLDYRIWRAATSTPQAVICPCYGTAGVRV